MSGTTCPNGHVSEAADYCDTCGAPMAPSSTPDSSRPSGPASAPVTPGTGASAATAAATQPCPSCAMTNTPEALFCEACGYDFTTGTMPRPSAPATSPTTSTNLLDLGATPEGATVPDPVAPAVKLEWVVEVWVDPDWYAGQESDEELPSPGLPVVVPLRTRSLLIGRRSVSRNIHPDIECASDVGVSRRQAQLTTDGQRWWVEDLQSSNGTYVGAASGPLPEDALPPGQRRELAQDDRIYLGAWTRIVVRRATPEEQAGQA
ncbi:MAG TPA: FHA domain-containing protein [Dermatophilaceae bacterium]|nr:FHA domain-containing protein [Dermatophilaceae bacterium]